MFREPIGTGISPCADVGWLETFDSYYYMNVSVIIPGVLAELQADAAKTFVWAEIAYFKV